MAVEGESSSRRFLDRLSEVNEKKDESPAVRLARATVEAYTRDEPLPDPADFSGLPEGEAGVFVSIHKFDALRGCIGTTAPTTASIGHEIVNNAIQACSSDPRFDQVTERELPYLTISVDVLNPAEPIADKSQLDPKKYGVIVRRGRRSGMLLHDLPGVDTVENQLSIARQKAGLDDDRGVEMYRFTVTRYE
jgi:AmmeMemoRadiSam system protein A